MANCFQAADILLPNKHISLQKWATVACDQFSSQIEYWERVEQFVGDAPSTYHMIFPEALLRQGAGEERVRSIHRHMAEYLDDGVFETYRRSFVYLERTMGSGKTRRGLVGQIDLEEYDFHPGSAAHIRATEGTVESRIPPRMALLEKASLEFPHTIVLCDDRRDVILSAAASMAERTLYDFDLMEGGGHMTGRLISGLGVGVVNSAVSRYIAAVEEGQSPGNTMAFAVGDGNHSLAAAKACWEKIKPGLTEEQRRWHPARYALVELENIHDPAIAFAPIHRIVRGKDAARLPEFLKAYAAPGGFSLRLIWEGREEKLFLPQGDAPLVLTALQPLLDRFCGENGCDIDYIHGETALRLLAAEPGTVGVLLPGMEKSELFPAVLRGGVLPRKTFSMGAALEKRYYLEGKKRI